MAKQIDKYIRHSVFTNLDQFDYFAKEHDFIEVTEWRNGEGFDDDLNSKKIISLSYGELDAIKFCVKKLNKE